MKKLFAPLCLSALALALAGCGKTPDAEEKTPLVKVRTEVIATAPLSINNELSGRIVAPRVAEVRARVAGVVLKRVYEEGSEVKQGDPLYRIDPRTYEAAVAQAEAVLAVVHALVEGGHAQADSLLGRDGCRHG